MGIAALVLGIVSIVSNFVGMGMPVGAICGLVSIILGAMGRKDPEKKGLATGGMVCSIIGFIFSIIVIVGCAACLGGLGVLGASGY